LRRAQAFAINNGVGLEICRRLIDAKLQGQEQVLRERLDRGATGDAIARFRNRLDSAENFDALRILESNAAASYFREWRDIPVNWPKADLAKIPERWRFIGSRQSLLSGGPRLAVTPAHAILNYCFALLEAETRLAISALGMDPGLGLGLHTDTANRDSLVFDVLEPIRPQVERWLLGWIASEPLRRADFFETATGNVRLMAPMCAKLSETAPVWGKLVAPWAEYVARTLWVSTAPSRTHTAIPTPLTQQHRREAKGRPPFLAIEALKPQCVCRVCGKSVSAGHKYCLKCDITTARERIVEIAKVGRVASQAPGPKARRVETQRRHALAKKAWQPSSLPTSLNEEVYTQKIQPLLAGVANPVIMSALGVSVTYAVAIRAGRRRPHPRHWEALAQMVGVWVDQ
jgi:hypothetical protein